MEGGRILTDSLLSIDLGIDTFFLWLCSCFYYFLF